MVINNLFPGREDVGRGAAKAGREEGGRVSITPPVAPPCREFEVRAPTPRRLCNTAPWRPERRSVPWASPSRHSGKGGGRPTVRGGWSGQARRILVRAHTAWAVSASPPHRLVRFASLSSPLPAPCWPRPPAALPGPPPTSSPSSFQPE